MTNRQLSSHLTHCRMFTTHTSLAADPWHWLTCPRLSKGELSRRHDSVVDATARVAWQVGAQVQREVEGLDPNSRLRPDLQIVFPGGCCWPMLWCRIH